MKTELCYSLIALALLAGVTQTSRAAVGFTVTPSAVSNTYSGDITLQITGLTNGETVVVQKFLDLNANGVIDSGDWLVQQFNLTDGEPGMVVGGVTNINVPGDLNAASGDVTAALNFQNGDFVQDIIGHYLYKIHAPTGRFPPLTTGFSVTNFHFAQSITGTVSSGSTGAIVPHALVILFTGPRPGHSSLGPALGGVVADATGAYVLRVPPGRYQLLAVSSNYVCNSASAPVVTLAAGQPDTADLVLAEATSHVPGKVADADDPGIGLPGVLVHSQTADGAIAAAFTGPDGGFNLPAASGTVNIGAAAASLTIQGYVGLDDGTNVTAGAAPVIIPVPKTTALIYGRVRDGQGNPLANVAVEAYDGANYGTQVDTDTNGDYVLGVVGLGSSDYWSIDVNAERLITNYVFSTDNDNADFNMNAGQAVLQNFTAIPATNRITGTLKDDHGASLGGIQLHADTTINGAYYDVRTDTDSEGGYGFNVPNGTWDVGVVPSSWGDSDGLPANYLQPADQSVTVSNNNAVADFTAILATNQITGSLTDEQGLPIAGIQIDGYATTNGVTYDQTADTDANGNFTLNVVNGIWEVGVSSWGASYLFPPFQEVVISNNNAVVNFTAIRTYTFTNSNGAFTYTKGDNTISIVGWTGSSPMMIIPGTINGEPVTSIGDGAFEWSGVTSIVIPGSVTNIGADAFYGCSVLRAVYFQGNAPFADSTVFANDNNPTVYYLPETTGWSATFAGLQAMPWNLLFFDNLQQFANGTDLTHTNYMLPAAPFATVFTSVQNGSPTITATNFLGSTWALFNNSMVTNKNQYKGVFALIATNRALRVTWKQWIQATNSGTGMFLLSLPVHDANPAVTYNPIFAFKDSGAIGALTNGTSPITSIGNWSSLAGTVMTNTLILDYPDRTFSYSLNSQPPVTLPLGRYFTNIINTLYFNGFESSASSLGNRFCITDIRVDLVAAPADFTFVTNNGAIAIIGYHGSGGNVVLPSEINGLPVTVIEDEAFMGDTNLVSLIIPSGVTTIGNDAFWWCTSLDSVTIPESVTSIGSRAFAYCTSLGSITLPRYIASIADETFLTCINLTNANIPDSVTNIGQGAFSSCSKLTHITIPDNVKTIGDTAFVWCRELNSVTIGSGVSSVGIDAFDNCANLTNVYFKGNAPSVYSGPIFAYSFPTIYYLPGTTGWGATFEDRPTAPWNPQVQTGGTGFGVRTNRFGFNITGTNNLIVVVDAATNLFHPVWLPVATNTLSGGASYFSDPAWTNYPCRFYRIRSP